MSEVLDLTERLRSLSDERLKEVLRELMLVESRYQDFYDLAEALLQPRNLDTWLSTLSSEELDEILNFKSKGKSNDSLLEFLKNSNSVATWMNEHRSELKNETVHQDLGFTHQAFDKANNHDIGIRIYETCLAVTDILQYFARNKVGKGQKKESVHVSHRKVLSETLNREPKTIMDIVDFMEQVQLVHWGADRWLLTDLGASWFDLSTTAKWVLLAEGWLSLLGAKARKLIAAENSDVDLVDYLQARFPLAKTAAATARFNILDFAADQLGLVATLMPQLCQKGAKALEVKISELLPREQGRIIVQSDLSIIAPGPLEFSKDKAIREFVETEQAGIASRYRLTPMSLQRALEAGISASQISQTLQSLSDQPLPQPVLYLINDAEKRFGQIKIWNDSETGGCLVEFVDTTRLLVTLNDVSLAMFGFKQIGEHTIWSPRDLESVHAALCEAGTIPTRVSPVQQVQNEIATLQETLQSQQTQATSQFIGKLRTADQALLSQSSDEGLIRQVHFAIKNKVSLEVSYEGKDGKTYEFVLEPSAVANGRLRGRDRKADIERTLNISNIVAVQLVPGVSGKK